MGVLLRPGELERDYDVCPDSPDHKHEADGMSAVQADDSPFIVDYACRYCGQSGSVAVERGDIAWA